MKPESQLHRAEEVELKLALPAADPAGIGKELARTPLLARRKATQRQLHNVYYDTPERILHQQRIALRTRRVGGDQKPLWLQTLKIGGNGDSALSKRGEWETSISGATLSRNTLQSTPWPTIDPDGKIFQALTPCFETRFERTSWAVRRRDGTLIEVAFDRGQITAGEKSTPICELELELLKGQPAELFEVAHQLARTIAVLPVGMSKAERGYALVQGCLHTPLRALPPKLTRDLSTHAAAGLVLREMFTQFTTNLNTLRYSDDPEVTHQARVGWRRFTSAVRLFSPTLDEKNTPTWQALQPLLRFLGDLRDLDVALTDTLPPLADAYIAGDGQRAQVWEKFIHSLQHEASSQRASVRNALQVSAVGASLLETTHSLESLAAPNAQGDAAGEPEVPLRRWARQRLAHLRKKLKVACKDIGDPESRHRARKVAKRLRYGCEALFKLLPADRAAQWQQKATDLQAKLGAERDVLQTSVLAARLGTDPGLAEFLRGVAVGRARRR